MTKWENGLYRRPCVKCGNRTEIVSIVSDETATVELVIGCSECARKKGEI